MISTLFNRRDFSLRLAWLFPGLGFTRSVFGAAGGPRAPGLAGDEEVSHQSESIHQEVIFKATRKRVYEAITDAGQFSKVTKFSSVPDAPPAEISHELGGTFSLFGGHIVGRHVELVPNERIVQAWRVVDWDAGIYSIARFELQEQGTQTRLVFDHTGFPNGLGKHLAAGWKSNYWEPLQKYLS